MGVLGDPSLLTFLVAALLWVVVAWVPGALVLLTAGVRCAGGFVATVVLGVLVTVHPMHGGAFAVLPAA